jgi:hypothetical protein
LGYNHEDYWRERRRYCYLIMNEDDALSRFEKSKQYLNPCVIN